MQTDNTAPKKEPLYRKKPVVIEAIKYNNLNRDAVCSFVGRELHQELESETAYLAGKGAPQFSLLIETKEGVMKAFNGDYVIKEPFPTGDRDFYPCKPDIFEKTYEEVKEETHAPQQGEYIDLAEEMSAEFTKHHLTIGGFHGVLHQFKAPDKGGPHDHPFNFTTHILKGSYIERVYYIDKETGAWTAEDYHRRAGTVHKIRAEHIHEIIELPDGECWTMIFPEEKVRESCFWKFDHTGVSVREWNQKEFKPL